MCARFSLDTRAAEIESLFETPLPEGVQPRYNIAPTQNVLAILVRDGAREARFIKWGLVPSWARNPSIGHRLINARAESAAQKASFRTPFRKRRCILPATSFFEWKHQTVADVRADDARRDLEDSVQLSLWDAPVKSKSRPKEPIRKQPYLVRLKDGRPFGMAALWDRWYDDQDRPVETCTILTTLPNGLVAPLHDRMPCILRPDDFSAWLDPSEEDPRALMPLLLPYPEDEMVAYPVGPEVNSPLHEDPELLRRVA